MQKYSSKKEINQLIKKLIKQGFRYEYRGKHGAICSPDNKHRIFVAKTPSDKRAYMKLKSNLKNAGFGIHH